VMRRVLDDAEGRIRSRLREMPDGRIVALHGGSSRDRRLWAA
jgi:hypothetical protein